jgi:hypothetical protein
VPSIRPGDTRVDPAARSFAVVRLGALPTWSVVEWWGRRIEGLVVPPQDGRTGLSRFWARRIEAPESLAASMRPPACAGHPDAVLDKTAVQLPAALVLSRDGGQCMKDLGHYWDSTPVTSPVPVLEASLALCLGARSLAPSTARRG